MINRYWLSKIVKLRIIGEIEEDAIETIIDVLTKIPEKDALVLLKERNVHFHIPVSDSSHRILMSTKVRTKPQQLPDGQYHVDTELWLVCLAPELLSAPRHQVVYKLAHELAHIYLRHGSLDHLKSDGAEDGGELEADLLVVDWGFEKEFSQCPDTYLPEVSPMEFKAIAARR